MGWYAELEEKLAVAMAGVLAAEMRAELRLSAGSTAEVSRKTGLLPGQRQAVQCLDSDYEASA